MQFWIVVGGSGFGFVDGIFVVDVGFGFGFGFVGEMGGEMVGGVVVVVGLGLEMGMGMKGV